jgi:hypothetical protein
MVPDIFQESFHRFCGTPAGQVLCGFLTHISPPVQAVFSHGGLTSMILIWLVTVQVFRWKRYNAIHRQFQAKYKEGLTPEEASSYSYRHYTTCLFYFAIRWLSLFLRCMEL